jgi:hypothetical protein
VRCSLIFACKTHEIEKSSKFKSANMAANLPESRIPPTAAGWFWQYRLALNPPKGMFSIRLCLSGPRGPHAVSRALGICWR